MCEFIRVNSQEVKHKTGYRVYSVGREFLEYKDADVTYKIHSEFGGGLEKNNIKMYIFTSWDAAVTNEIPFNLES